MTAPTRETAGTCPPHPYRRVLSLVILLALFGAATTHAIGLHAVFGGFIVGLTVGRSARVRERTRVVGPDGGVVVMEGKEVVMQLPHAESSVTNVEFFMNVKLEKEGVYWVEILLDGDLKLRYPLRVNRVVPAQAAGGDKAMLA